MSKAAYLKEWRAKNKDKVAASNKRYAEKRRAADHEAYAESLRQSARVRRATKPETIRGYDLKAKYGMSVADLVLMRENQRGCCAICDDPMRVAGPSGMDREYVDHCHETGVVRGLLCGRCNTSIGKFNDDPVLLEAAAGYLRRYNEVVPE